MNAFKHFVHNQADNIFLIEVKSILKLNMVTDFVSVGVSFRSTGKQVIPICKGRDGNGCHGIRFGC
jgi:hypothetical protein